MIAAKARVERAQPSVCSLETNVISGILVGCGNLVRSSPTDSLRPPVGTPIPRMAGRTARTIGSGAISRHAG